MAFKSTQEILTSIRGRTKPDLWKRIKDIPEFDPVKHSDGCSGGMSENYKKLRKHFNLKEEYLPWRECCVTHDRAYYYGGSEEEKRTSDEILKQCVSKKLDNEVFGYFIGSAMQAAVSIGGLPYFKTSYRWGYGEDFRNTENLPAKTESN